MACDKCGARTIEIIKPGEPCPLCEAREKVKAQALQIVKLREALDPPCSCSNPHVDQIGGGRMHSYICPAHEFRQLELKEKALALNTKDAEKMVAEIRTEVWENIRDWTLMEHGKPWCQDRVVQYSSAGAFMLVVGKAQKEIDTARARSEGK